MVLLARLALDRRLRGQGSLTETAAAVRIRAGSDAVSRFRRHPASGGRFTVLASPTGGLWP